MTGILTFLLYLLAVCLIVLVLIQPDRSNGMSGGIGNGATSQIFGVSKDGGPLAKATQLVGASFLVVSLMIYLLG
jgi:preprotein translocase subunit SecG